MLAYVIITRFLTEHRSLSIVRPYEKIFSQQSLESIDMNTVHSLQRPGKPRLSYIVSPASEAGAAYPAVLFLGGFRSEMMATKASYLSARAAERGQMFIRFDYTGHGRSDGAFEECTISTWKNDALDVFDMLVKGPVVLVGSSMGGWLALLLGLERTGLIKGLLGIAAAPDFTDDLYARMEEGQKYVLQQQGVVRVPIAHSEDPYVITQALLDDGKKNNLLHARHKTDFPIRIVQGMRDEDVAWQTAHKIQKAFAEGDVDVLFIEDGDHRLSRPQDLELIDRELRAISGYL